MIQAQYLKYSSLILAMNDTAMPSYKQTFEELEVLSTSPTDEFKLYLVKEISTSAYKMAKKTSIYECSDKSQDNILHEVKMLKELKNPHIIKYHDVFLDENDFIVILEFCEEGDLDYYLKKRKERKEQLSEKLVLSWVMQILMALEYVHSKNVIHRLISPHNIYLNHQGDVKLGSFGGARELANTLEKALTVVGSPCNLSPQIVEGKPYDSKADIWALGCLIYELATFEHPYQIKNLPQLYEMIVKVPTPDLPLKYSKYLNPIFRKMMKKSPKSRPCASELLQEEVFLKLMKEYTKKKKIDSLDLREITPRQLLIHKKKRNTSLLPPLNPHKSAINENQLTSSKGSYKKLKNNNEQPLSKSRQKLNKIKPQPSIKEYKSKGQDLPLDRPTLDRGSPLLDKGSPLLERGSPPLDKKLKVKKQESPKTKQGECAEQDRITKPNLDEGEYISLLCQLKLQLLTKKYEPNMEQIFEQTIEFD